MVVIMKITVLGLLVSIMIITAPRCPTRIGLGLVEHRGLGFQSQTRPNLLPQITTKYFKRFIISEVTSEFH